MLRVPRTSVGYAQRGEAQAQLLTPFSSQQLARKDFWQGGIFEIFFFSFLLVVCADKLKGK